MAQATTPALFGDMKREIKARGGGGWKSVRWSMVKRPSLGQLDILHGRIMAQNPKVCVHASIALQVATVYKAGEDLGPCVCALLLVLQNGHMLCYIWSKFV